MAASVALVSSQYPAVSVGGMRGRVVQVSFTAADYATGGYSITPQSVNLNEVYGAFVLGVSNNAITTGVYWQYNAQTQKLQAFVSNGASPAFLNEAPAATDVSAQKVRLLIVGV